MGLTTCGAGRSPTPQVLASKPLGQDTWRPKSRP